MWHSGIDWFIYFSKKACTSIYSFRQSWDSGGNSLVVLGAIIMMQWDDVMSSIPCWLFFFKEYQCLGCDFGLWFCSVLCRCTEEKPACTGISDPFITETAFGTEGWNERLYSPNTPPPYPGGLPLTLILKQILEKSWYCLLIYRKGKKKTCDVLADTMREGSRSSDSGLLQEHQYLFFKWLKGKSR